MKKLSHIFLLAAIISFLFSGCDSAPQQSEFPALVARTKAEAKPSAIKAAVLPMFSVSSHQPRRQVPPEVAKLPLFEKAPDAIRVSEFADPEGKVDGLMFMTGDAARNWGVLVCSTKAGEAEAQKLKFIPWEDGLYFFERK